MAAVSKEEYLKRYLSGRSSALDQKKTSKKKKSKVTSNSFKLVEDDAFVPVSSQAKLATVSSDEEEEERRLEELAKKDLSKGTFRPIGFVEVSSSSGGASKPSAKVFTKAQSSSKKDSDDDSPLRRRNDSNSDASPRRRVLSSPSSRPRQRHDSDSDVSPPRARRRSSTSPPRKKQRHDSDSDLSPPRRSYNSQSDASPPRKRDRRHNSPHRHRSSEDKHSKRNFSSRPSKTHARWDDDDDLSPVRKRDSSREKRRAASPDKGSSMRVKEEPKSPSFEDSLKKTLDGKKAGLQSAKDLKEEGEKLRQKEAEMFEGMDAERSGRGAETVHRTKQYGKRDRPEDKERKEREAKKQAELQEKYKDWNKGVAQIANRKEQLEEMARVAAEPLARAADDEAMNEHLKTVIYEDDPMEAFMRKKKTEEDIRQGKLIYPQYEGAWPPNRFGIAPGYRWDGVDRSNGFEGRLSMTANRRAADEREFYAAIATYD